MTRPARIPADVNRPDRVVGPFTARQAAILAGTGAALYLLWTVLRSLLAAPVFLAAAVPVAAAAVVIALGQRDGLSMDRLVVAAVRHRFAPRARPPDPPGANASAGAASTGEVPGWIHAHTTVDDNDPPSSRGDARRRRLSGFPARAVTPVQGGRGPGGVGVVDLGPDGLVVIAVVSTVNFALRTPAEQDGLVAGFARYLHALGGPVQILIRALPVDLHTHLHQLHTQARHLPHPALAAAARDHLTHLALLARQDGDNQLLTRQVLLVVREPGRPGSRTSAPDRSQAEHRQPGHRQPGHRHPDHSGHRQPGVGAGEHRLLRRLHDAAALLAAIDVAVTVLDAAHTTALLTATCNPAHVDTNDGLDDSVIGGSARGGLDDSLGHGDNGDEPLAGGLDPDQARDAFGRYDGRDTYGAISRTADYDDRHPNDDDPDDDPEADFDDFAGGLADRDYDDLEARNRHAGRPVSHNTVPGHAAPDNAYPDDAYPDDAYPDDAEWDDTWTASPPPRAAGRRPVGRWTR